MQTIRFFACLMCGILALLTPLSANGEDKGKKDSVPAGWQLVKPKIGGVTFFLPKGELTKYGNGKSIDAYIAIDDGHVFTSEIRAIEDLKKPGNSAKVLTAEIKKRVDAAGGKLVSQKKISLGSHPGVEYKATTKNSGDVICRCYAINNYLISLQIGSLRNEKDRATYFNSLKLVKK